MNPRFAAAISSDWHRARAAVAWWFWYAFVSALTLSIAATLVISRPSPAIVGWLFFACGALAIIYEPRYGLYLTLFSALVGDMVLLPWYPFTKNFSSAESLLHLNNQSLIFSPLEVYLVLTLLVWLFRGGMQRKLDFHRGSLFLPTIVFIAFIAMGLVFGIGTGGDSNVALWEARAMFYLPLMLVLTSNLITTRGQASAAVWTAMLALAILGTIGVWDFVFVDQWQISRIQMTAEHGTSIRMNTLFVLALAVWLCRASIAKRLILPLLAMPCLVTYFVAQRRAAFVALGFALVLMAMALFRENRRAFWLIVPPIALLALLYVGAFWNSQNALGLPARAVRSVVSPNSGTPQEVASSVYRIMENINIGYTIQHSNPLTGIGFGHKFFVVVPLPDISWFVWYEYVTHNSLLYIWMKAGVLAFLALLTIIGLTITTGVRALWRVRGGDLRAIGLTALLYVVMHFTFAYVDMSWDALNMVYLGMMIGLLNSIERIAGTESIAAMADWLRSARHRSKLTPQPPNLGPLWTRVQEKNTDG